MDSPSPSRSSSPSPLSILLEEGEVPSDGEEVILGMGGDFSFDAQDIAMELPVSDQELGGFHRKRAATSAPEVDSDGSVSGRKVLPQFSMTTAAGRVDLRTIGMSSTDRDGKVTITVADGVVNLPTGRWRTPRASTPTSEEMDISVSALSRS